MTSNALPERVLYALSRPEAAETGRMVRHLATLLDEPREEVLAALRVLQAQGRVTLSNASEKAGGLWWLADPPPNGYVLTRINPTAGEPRRRATRSGGGERS